MLGIVLWLAAVLQLRAMGPTQQSTTIFQAAARAQLTTIQKSAQSGINPLDTDSRGYGIVSNVLQGLQQQLEQFPRPGWNTSAHTPVLATLMNASSTCKLLGVNRSVAQELLAVSCPVVDASSLRLMRWVPLFLDSMSPVDVRDCLVERNAWGETSAHGAASAKASGFARIILRSTSPQTLSHAPWMRQITGVAIDALATQAAIKREVFFSDIVRAVDTTDLAQLLHAGTKVFPNPEAISGWLDIQDQLNRTAIAIACSQGRWLAIQLLLDATQSTSNSSVIPTNSHQVLPAPNLSRRKQAVQTCSKHLARNGFHVEPSACPDSECLHLLQSYRELQAGPPVDHLDVNHQPQATILAETALKSLERAMQASCTAAAALMRGRGSSPPKTTKTTTAEQQAQSKRCNSKRGWGVPIAEHIERVSNIVKQIPAAQRGKLIAADSGADALQECLLHGDAPCILRAGTPWRFPSGLTRFAEIQSAASKRRARSSSPRRTSKMQPGTAVVGRSAFLEACGNLPTRLSTVPYAGSYGLDSSVPSTLSHHCRENMGIKGMKRLAAWLLESSEPHTIDESDSAKKLIVLDGWRPQYSFQALPGALIERVSPTPSNETIALALREHIAELIVGPPGSGAMSHFHGPAVNALAVGSKLWVVFTPACASFSMRHPAEWLQRLPQWIREHSRCADPWMFVQHAGDSVAVPRHFGHAVFNLQDTVAVAYEQP